ncbi:GNAT family N-acetyltransferase [Candidatus Bathyarchaeota archaeon]|nr:GNAT family N-acetyltransferase [Candidatus Bathyarchaeota archaeon]
MFHVEKMEADDVPFAVQLSNTMNWNMKPADFKFMMKLEPDGCFVLFNDQLRLGIATSISFGKAGWFGNLVVKEESRREGAGKLLTMHAVNYLKKIGVKTVGLFAYPHLVNFYKKVGFKSDIDFIVLKGNSTISKPQDILAQAKKRDVSEIIAFDKQCFGADRRKLLEPILFDPNNLCYISTEKGSINGYIVAKVSGKTAEVGPLICSANRGEETVLLLETILSRLNGVEIFIYIPKKEAELLKILTRAGLKEDFYVIRMFLGSAFSKNCIYTAESLERG